MAFFPFMIQLNDKSCLIAGGGEVAYRKLTLMHEFGAEVYVVAPHICEEIYALAETSGRIHLIDREVCEKDIEDRDIVIMATDDSELNSHYAGICRQRRILVNVVDVKKDCGFYFPAVIKQDEVVIGISTGGSSPLLAARIKKDIKDSLRPDYGVIARDMDALRDKALREKDSEQERREYFREELEKRL